MAILSVCAYHPQTQQHIDTQIPCLHLPCESLYLSGAFICGTLPSGTLLRRHPQDPYPHQLFCNLSSAEYHFFQNFSIVFTGRPLSNLGLEYIHIAVSIIENLSCLTPQLALRAVRALRGIPKAGVLHILHWQKSIVIDGEGSIRWVDFDSGVCGSIGG
jgi:hypothetical protein